LAVEPFRPILEVLKQIEEEDTELAFRAAHLVGYSDWSAWSGLFIQ
jgi:hypothetical protein